MVQAISEMEAKHWKVFLQQCIGDKKMDTKENNKQNEQGSVLYTVLALVIIVVIIAAVIYYVPRALQYLLTFIIWFTAQIPKLDAVIIVALITGIASLIIGVINKVIDYNFKKREYLTEHREVPYTQFVDMVYRIQETNKGTPYSQEDMNRDIHKFSTGLTLWGSPLVVMKWKEFMTKVSDSKDGIDNLFLIEEIMNQMRKDLGVKKTSKGRLLGIFVKDIDDYTDK